MHTPDASRARHLARTFAPLVADACRCGEPDCWAPACDRCGEGHAYLPVSTPHGERLVCGGCAVIRDCDGCQQSFPRWRLTRLPDAGSFCAGCCHVAPGELW